jgi:nitrogen fixation/metabolism regulation signal transduction histidine kinase
VSNRNAARWTLAISLVAVIGAVLVLSFLVTVTVDSVTVERHFAWLFWVNVVVASMLSLVIVVAMLRLLSRLRSGKFGSRLLLKLAAMFALVGVVPGVLIYTVSYQFVSRSIESWFDVRVARALDAGLSLSRGAFAEIGVDLAAKTRDSASRLAEGRGEIGLPQLERVRAQLGVAELSLVGGDGGVLAHVGGRADSSPPERAPVALLDRARAGGVANQIDGLDDEPVADNRPAARVRVLAAVPDPAAGLTPADARFLMAVQPLPRLLVTDALAVEAAYRDYQQRAIARNGLRGMYIGALTLTLVLAVFGALLLAVTLGNQIARPLVLLADGVRQVAAGDLTAKPVFDSQDELGGLTRAFAEMTQQIADARELVQRGVSQLEGARRRLQTILDSLSAGVIVFDRAGRIETVNPAAARILRQPLSSFAGQTFDAIPGLSEFAREVWQRTELHRTSPEAGEVEQWQDAFELRLQERELVNLLVRGAMLPGEGRLLVFDDITELASAQRTSAWSEVARRLAHEIKNPLTPIQLSAERLTHRLASKLDEADSAMLERSVATIVAQVQAMERLVNEFRDYARLPAARLAPLDLSALVTEVLSLYGTDQEQGRLACRLPADLPAIEGDPTQLRQVIHNLVQNGLDAIAARADGRVTVMTEVARREDGAPRAVRLRVSDNGPGFADHVIKRASEPYVTTKAKGTGLGLAVVKKIAEEHHARLRIANLHADGAAEGPAVGAQVSISFSRFAPPVSTTIASLEPAFPTFSPTGGAMQGR